MTEPRPFPMDPQMREIAPPDPELTAGRAVALALLREAGGQQAAGRRLFKGRWRTPEADAQARSAARRQSLRDTAEMLLVWVGIALVGLALAGLAVLLV